MGNTTFKSDDVQMLITDVDKFLQLGGASGAVENLGNLLNVFFSSLDHDNEDEQGKPVKTYKSYDEGYVNDIVFVTMNTINFIVKLQETRDRIPGRQKC